MNKHRKYLSGEVQTPRSRRFDGAPERKASSLTPAFFLKAMLQWWLVATPVGLLFAAGAAAVVYLNFQPVYRAQATVQVRNDRFGDLSQHMPDAGALISTQRELMRTSLVISPLLTEIAHFDGVRDADDQVGYVASRIRVVALPNTDFFYVMYEDTNPQQARDIVNLIVDSSMHFQRDLDFHRVQELKRKLKDELEMLAKQVDDDGATVIAREQEWLEQDPLGEKSTPLNDASRLPMLRAMEQQAIAAERISHMHALIASLEKALDEKSVEISSTELDAAVNEHETVARLQGALEGARYRFQDVDSKTPEPKDKSTLYNSAKSEVARLEEEQKTLIARVRGEQRERLTEDRLSKLEDDHTRAQAELAEHERTLKFYDAQFDRQLTKLKNREGPAFRLELARWNLERSKTTYSKVLDHLNLIEMLEHAPAKLFSMQVATVPIRPVESLPYKQLIMAAMAAFCVPFGLAVLWEYRVRRVSDSLQLEEQSSLSVVGEVASFPVRVKGSSHSGRAARGMRLFEESIDSLRTFLVLAQPMRDVQVLAVTSAASREGKTSIASQLAVSIARATGELTLIIDGDMRKPDVHEIFGVELQPGLAQVLSGEVEFDDAVDTSWSDRVHILPAGELTTSPHRLLGNGAMSALLAQARGRYRHIVIDTPPVLSASEALMLAAAADASLVCVMRNYSRVEQVTKTCQRLNEAGANVVGSVLSGVPTKQYAKYYGDYSYTRS